MSKGGGQNKIKGSVMVVGGGISGMQSSLDLAESGLKVHLVEEKTAIGGIMSRLDKTFPTNDCAMCIVSPKLVDVGRHLNIDIMTGTRVKSVEGEPGNFKVLLQRTARYIDTTKCTGCGECAAACPVELPSEFDGGLGQRNAAYKLYAQAIPTAYAIEKKGVSPCRVACPAGVNVQGYVQLIKAGKYIDSWRLIYESNPFPAVCGRICTHPCETQCHRGSVDSPVSIRELKRFTADRAYEDLDSLPLPEAGEQKDDRVAVIGSGPAGMSAAYHLTKQGYKVTVFEALPVAGGMLRVGIPEYRLPKEVVDVEISLFEKQGIEIRTNSRLGRDFTINDLKEQGYGAVLLALGTHRGVALGLPGEDAGGVMSGVDLLRKVNQGEQVEMGRRVAVIGGGNVAIDTARTALRQGAGEVTIVCLESQEEMPAHESEISEALDEGIRLHTRWGPEEIVKSTEGRVTGLRLKRVKRVFDDQGKFSPEFDAGTTDLLDVDHVILSVGQRLDLSGLDDGLAKNRNQTIKVDQANFMTNLPGVFAAGDAVTGPATVIDAIGAGKKAAQSIGLFLQGEDAAYQDEFEGRNKVDFPQHRAGNIEIARAEPSFADPERRVKNFREVAQGITEEQARAEAERCLNCAVCSECSACVKACQADAIDHSMQDFEEELEVGAMILNPGGDIYDPTELSYLGYGQFPNVVTSIEFERILSASGPYQGHLMRPSDGKEPRKIAWIQCVGSRNLKIKHDYCSSVCCMYAIKEAVIAKEHSSEQLDATIFLMDMRSYGKDFERYYNRARDEHGVRFVRSRIFNVLEAGDSGGLTIRYSNQEGQVLNEDFDMVVLSVGFKPSCASTELAAAAGIELDRFGFCKTGELSRGITSQPGIFASGVFNGPKDIPETVVEASAAAGYASRMLAAARGTLTSVQEYPPEKEIGKGAPRTGVFVCNCGINIGSVVNVPEVVAYAQDLKNVVYAREFLFTCSQDSVEKIKELIVEQDLTRVVVASCTPRTHAPLFMSALREAGLNPYLYEHVNIREHSSWVHRENKPAATRKAKDLIRMAVAKVALLKPVTPARTKVVHASLVVGGGAAGMTAALSLAEQGFDVYLVEKQEQLGGHLNHIQYTLEGTDPQLELGRLMEQITTNPRITVYTGAEILDADGYPGNYRTLIQVNGKTKELEHGSTILAAGGGEVTTTEYMYGQHQNVVSQKELEQALAAGRRENLENVVMIQCVGSRNEERPYCSRICCQQALKNALKIKEINPDANIYVLYRDLRAYGLMEQYYTKARQEGVIFIRYDLQKKPTVLAGEDGLEVTVQDHVLGRQLTIQANLLVLSTGIKPNPDNLKLSQLFKVPLDADGFLLEAHMKLRPVDFSADGLYLCGLAHAPKLAGESIQQANAAAMRAVTLLSKEELENVAITAMVNKKRCVGCSVCVDACDYNARILDAKSKVAQVNEALCQGCGACVVACPSGASQQKGYEKSQMLAALGAALV